MMRYLHGGDTTESSSNKKHFLQVQLKYCRENTLEERIPGEVWLDG